MKILIGRKGLNNYKMVNFYESMFKNKYLLIYKQSK